MEIVELLFDKIKLYLPNAIAEAQKNKVARLILSQVSEDDISSLTPLELRTLVEELYEDYDKSKVEPGKMVGVIAAQTMGEIQTQATLNAHRDAGLAKGREQFSGLPRLVQIFENNEPSIPSMLLYPKKRHTLQEMKTLITRLQYAIIDDLLDGDPILRESEDPSVADLPFHQVFMKIYGTIEKTRWVLRFKFNVQKLYNMRLPLSNIASAMRNVVKDSKIIFSDIATGIIDLYYTGNEIMEGYKTITKLDEDVYYFIRDNVINRIRSIHVGGIANISKVFLDSTLMNSIMPSVTQLPGKDRYKINIDSNTMRMRGIDIEWVKEWLVQQLNNDAEFDSDLEFTSKLSKQDITQMLSVSEVPLANLIKKNKLDSKLLVLHGLKREDIISNVEENLPQLLAKDGSFIGQIPLDITFVSEYRQFLSEVWFVETKGINLIDIKFVPEFNPNCTWCNYGTTMLENYGIESATKWIEIESDKAGTAGVPREHKSLLFDTATKDGIIHAIHRNGLDAMNFEFLTHGNFEKSAAKFLESGMTGRTDSMAGVASSIISGNLAQVGSNFTETIFDPELSKQMERRIRPPKITKLVRKTK